MRQSAENQSLSTICYMVEKSFEVEIEKCLCVEALVAMIMNFNSDCIE